MKTLAILVGGGPAPGINAVISAATIEARNCGLRVLGCEAGFKWLMQGDLSRVHELDIAGVSQIHFEGGSILRTARANPTRSPEALQHVVESLRRLDVSYLLTIGGDDTAFGTSRVARALDGRVAVAREQVGIAPHRQGAGGDLLATHVGADRVVDSGFVGV